MGCHLTDTAALRRSRKSSRFAWSGALCAYFRLEPQPTRLPPSSAWTTDPELACDGFSLRLLYFAAVRAPGTVGSGFRIMFLTWGGAMGIRTPDLLHAMKR